MNLTPRPVEATPLAHDRVYRRLRARIMHGDLPPGHALTLRGLAAEYDVPPDAWYFRDNGAAAMPISVLMEVMLQPCGWLASYMGFALTDGDLAFRNLDGDWAVPTATVGPDAGTLTVRTRLTRYSRVGEMTIVFFRVDCDGRKGRSIPLTPPSASSRRGRWPIRSACPRPTATGRA